MAKVRIPTPLQPAAGNRPEVECKGGTVDELIADLDRQHPGIRSRLCEADGRLRRFLNLYLNDTDVRTLKAGATPVQPNDEVSIVPAIAGGC